jgi:hypothetical protein
MIVVPSAQRILLAHPQLLRVAFSRAAMTEYSDTAIRQ